MLFCFLRQAAFANRPALGMYPPSEFAQILSETLLSVAPRGINQVQTMACGACSVEHALKGAFMAYRRRERGGSPPTQEEIETSLLNTPPGCPKLSVLSFKNAFHGRTMGALALSHTKWVHKLDFPSPCWPFATFPSLKYPLEEFADENNAEDARCLAEVQDKIASAKRAGQPVACVATEPMQCEGGDRYGSPNFFQGLQDICQENGIALLLDEVQTGAGASGKFWLHEHFYLRDPPNLVTFAKKMLTGGFYYTPDMRPSEAIGKAPGQRLPWFPSSSLEQGPMPTEENLLRRTAQPVSPTKTSPDRDHRIYGRHRYIYELHLASPDQSTLYVESRPKKSFSGQLDRNERTKYLPNY
ncbi:hypothetical protein RRG08_024515 [Elysia crispata]|uniref:Uncharacterized protein n=1 Tax=Elysia crispata TaxID=231223 RepID=A0AAE0ZF75_9GAST|nr:hypothetical protein RRG08_024515 [Elysia crispata]